VRVAAASNIRAKDVAVGVKHVCVMDAAGKAYCWGSNEYGQVGNGTFGGSFSTAIPVSTTRSYDSFIKFGYANHTCARTQNGEVDCWGREDFGVAFNTPTPVASGRSLRAFSKNGDVWCMVAEDGKPYCWGRNDSGQLGNGTVTQTPTATPGPLATSELAADIALISNFSGCLLTQDGRVFCWGQSTLFRTNAPVPTPVQIASPVRFTRLVHGGGAYCALTADGAAYCVGASNPYGTLGNGTTQGSTSFAPVVGDLRFKSVTTGWGGQVCGIATSGAAYCWGANTAAQGGNRTTENSLAPSRVADPVVL
jgi:alpha-tubulin suppressor-like RCC1 family protein